MLIYDAATQEQRAQISKFRDRAYGATYRSDGRLLVAGGETGTVQARPSVWIDTQIFFLKKLC